MNIQQASIYSGKSEKTLRRWIRKGDLLASKIEGKYDIQESDLDALMVQPAPDTFSERIAALESRVDELESLLHKKRPARPIAPSQPGKIPQEWMEGYTPIVDLIKQYNAPETTVMRNMRPYLKTGPWHTSDGRVVRYALDAEGVAEFMRRYGQ